MGYQITQYDEPIILGGKVEFEVNGEKSVVGITRAHLEADAGKSTHPEGKDYSLVDLNRAGTPLLEIVSEPDMHSAAEAKAYARELWLRMKYADVSEANLYYGNMRFDVNVSVSKTDQLGTRSETKNLNSFRSVEKAVEFEVERQIELLEKGEKIVQETRGWHDAKQKTFSQRSKENADDYRYMPDPDIPPVVLTDEYIDKIKNEMPMLPSDYRGIFQKLDLGTTVIEDLLAVPDIAHTVELVYGVGGAVHARRVAFWLLRPQQEEIDSADAKVDVSIANFIKLSQMVEDKVLSSTAAKEVLDDMLVSKRDPEIIAKEKDLLQVSDEGEIAKIVEQVLAENPKAAEDVKNGEMKAIGFLVGQVMKQSQGKANPGLAQELIKKQLSV
jgi:aspartyl-tRNA(Asn)/glutamyl-tRNA(Gln) amidotransferase subunit B